MSAVTAIAAIAANARLLLCHYGLHPQLHAITASRLEFSACGEVEPQRRFERLLTKQSKIGFHLIRFDVFQRIGDLAARGINDDIDLAKQGTN